jgi:hypothetical protein
VFSYKTEPSGELINWKHFWQQNKWHRNPGVRLVACLYTLTYMVACTKELQRHDDNVDRLLVAYQSFPVVLGTMVESEETATALWYHVKA